MKKYISYLLISCLLVTTCFIPATAAGEDLGFYSVDLMASDYIHQEYSNIAGTNTGEAEYLGIDQYGARNVITYTWTPAADQSSYQDIYFNFFLKTTQTQASIQSVSVKLDASNAYTGATLVGSYGSLSSGRIYQYRFSNERAVTSISVRIQFNINVTGAFGMTSVIGYRNVGETISSVNFYGAEYYRNSVGNLTHSYITPSGSNPRSIPYQYDDYGSDSTWYYNAYYLDLPGSLLSLTQYDSIVYNLTLIAPYGSSTDSILNDTTFWENKIGASLYVTGNGTSYQSLPFEVYSSVDYRYVITTPNQSSIEVDPEYLALKLTIVVDVSGVDLDGYTVDVSVQDVPLFEPQTGQKLTFIRIESIRAIPVITQQPWYSTLWSWIKDWWNDSNNWIYSGLVHIADTVKTWGENIVGALTPDDPDLPDVEDQLTTDASKFHDEMDVIETVPMPTLDPGKLPGNIILTPSDPTDPSATEDTQGFVDPSDPAGTDIMTTLTEVPNFVPAITIVLTIAVISLLLYGVGG